MHYTSGKQRYILLFSTLFFTSTITGNTCSLPIAKTVVRIFGSKAIYWCEVCYTFHEKQESG